MSRRKQKISELLRDRISEVLQREVKDPRIHNALVSVTSVDIAPNLSQAKVHVSILGTKSQKEDALIGCNAAAFFIRRRVGTDLALRRLPQITFVQDTTIEEADRLNRLIRNI
jgi:ribosome-binding factor A